MLGLILLAIVAIAHLYVAFLSVFYWNSKRNRKLWSISIEFALRIRQFGLIIGSYFLLIALCLLEIRFFFSGSFVFQRNLLFFLVIWSTILSLWCALRFNGRFILIHTIPNILFLCFY